MFDVLKQFITKIQSNMCGQVGKEEIYYIVYESNYQTKGQFFSYLWQFSSSGIFI